MDFALSVRDVEAALDAAHCGRATGGGLLLRWIYRESCLKPFKQIVMVLSKRAENTC
jgi:hypothetical protein